MRYVLDLFQDFLTFYEDTRIYTLTDPLSGSEVKAEVGAEGKADVKVKECIYPHPYKKLKNSERSEICPSKSETKPKESFKSETKDAKAPLAELEDELRDCWHKGAIDSFKKLVQTKGVLSKVEAEQFAEQLFEQGKVAYDPEGWLVWV